MFRVEIVQPSIPHYRAPLFTAVAERIDGIVTLHASAAESGGPPSAPLNSNLQTVEHATRVFAGGRALWQTSLHLPQGFGSGDVLIIPGNPRYLSNFPLMHEARKRGAGIVWWGHGWSSTSVPWRAWVRRQLMRTADVIMLYADQEVAQLKPISSGRTVFTATNNTLDPSRALVAQAQWSPERLLEFAQAHSIDGRKVALFCGRLRSNPSTGLGIAIQAMAHARREGLDPLLIVIGDGEERAQLEGLARQLNVSSSIRWLGSLYDEEQLAPWFALAHCFVYPGSVGLSLLHAFMYGLPVVTHNDVRLHYPEIHALRDSVNGLTFRRDDASDLWRAMREIFADPARQAAMSAAARHSALSEWSFDSMVQRFVGAIETARAMSIVRQNERNGESASTRSERSQISL